MNDQIGNLGAFEGTISGEKKNVSSLCHEMEFPQRQVSPAHRKFMNVFVTVDRLGYSEEVHI